MSGTTPPQFVQGSHDISLQAPSQNPQKQPVLLGPSEQAQNPDASGIPLTIVEESIKRRESQRQEGQDRDLLRIYQDAVQFDPEEAAEAKAKGIDLGMNPRLAMDDIGKVRDLWNARKVRMGHRSGGNRAVPIGGPS